MAGTGHYVGSLGFNTGGNRAGALRADRARCTKNDRKREHVQSLDHTLRYRNIIFLQSEGSNFSPRQGVRRTETKCLAPLCKSYMDARSREETPHPCARDPVETERTLSFSDFLHVRLHVSLARGPSHLPSLHGRASSRAPGAA